MTLAAVRAAHEGHGVRLGHDPREHRDALDRFAGDGAADGLVLV